MTDKRSRQERIRKILGHNEIHSQEQLQDLLAAESIAITQATLSRDLREIGAIRSPRGYLVSANRNGGPLDTKVLAKAFRGVILDVRRGGTLVVLRTEPGHGPLVAREIESAGMPQVLGAMAAQDIVFVATGSTGEAREVLRLLRQASR